MTNKDDLKATLTLLFNAANVHNDNASREVLVEVLAATMPDHLWRLACELFGKIGVYPVDVASVESLRDMLEVTDRKYTGTEEHLRNTLKAEVDSFSCSGDYYWARPRRLPRRVASIGAPYSSNIEDDVLAALTKEGLIVDVAAVEDTEVQP